MPRAFPQRGLGRLRRALVGFFCLMGGHAGQAQSRFYTIPPVDTVAEVGTPFTLRAQTSTGETTCQWYRDGEPFPGGTQTTLTVANAQPSHAGLWHCLVSRNEQSFPSPPARVDVLPQSLWPGASALGSRFPETFTAVHALAVDSTGRLLVAGLQGGVETLLRLLADGSVDATFPAISANGEIRALLPATNALWVGGAFTTLNGQSASRLARLAPDGSIPSQAAFAADATVHTLARHTNNAVLAAGSFTNINGAERHRLARFGVSQGTLDPAFNVGPSSPFNLAGQGISCLAVEMEPTNNANLGRIVAGGTFLIPASPNPRERLVRLLNNGVLDTSFTANTRLDREVRALAVLPDGAVFAGGEFTGSTVVGGLYSQPAIAKIRADGNLDPLFAPRLTVTAPSVTRVQSISLLPGNTHLLLAGKFSTVDTFPRHSLAVLTVAGKLEHQFLPPPFLRAVSSTAKAPALISRALEWQGRLFLGGDFTTPPALAQLHWTPPLDPPVFPPVPARRSLSPGSGHVLRLAASGNVLTSHQWRKNGIPLPESTGPELLLPRVAPGDFGDYTVTATNTFGIAASTPIHLEPLNLGWTEPRWSGFGPATPGTLPDGGIVDSAISVTETAPMARIRVRMDFAHLLLDSVSIHLIPPPALGAGAIRLINRGNGTGLRGRDLAGTEFDSASPVALDTAPAPHRGCFQADPAGGFTTVLGKSPAGVWTLRVEDYGLFDGLAGNLRSWSIQFQRPGEPATWNRWAATFLPSPASTSPTPTADANGNRIPDLLEFALPSGPGEVTNSPDQPFLRLRQARWSLPNLIYHYETSPDLRTWQPTTPQILLQTAPNDKPEELTLQFPAPSGRNFLRTRVQWLP